MGATSPADTGEGSPGSQDCGPGGYQGPRQGQCSHHQVDGQELSSKGVSSSEFESISFFVKQNFALIIVLSGGHKLQHGEWAPIGRACKAVQETIPRTPETHLRA